MVGQPHRKSMKMASWSRVSVPLITLIGISDKIKWNDHIDKKQKNPDRTLQSRLIDVKIITR